MIKLSPTTRALAERLFAESEVEEAVALLESECAENLPLINSPTPAGLERIRFAALRASQGDLARLFQMVELAQVDWRDLLVVAGFAQSTTEHARWAHNKLSPADMDPK